MSEQPDQPEQEEQDEFRVELEFHKMNSGRMKVRRVMFGDIPNIFIEFVEDTVRITSTLPPDSTPDEDDYDGEHRRDTADLAGMLKSMSDILTDIATGEAPSIPTEDSDTGAHS